MIVVAFLMFVGLLAVGVVALVVVRAATLDYEKTKSRLHEARAETLVYDVPHGRDAIDVMLALSHGGFTAIEECAHGRRQVLVGCPHGRLEDRPRVRAVIEQVYPSGLTRVGARVEPVQFADEH
jgi:hypothetical protein